MLRLARQRLGLTQKDASKRLGIPQPLLSRFENRVSEPDDALLIKAGRVYDMPRSFFEILEPIYGPPVSVHTMLRGRADVRARDVDLITAELNIRVIHLRRLLEGVDFVPTFDIPSICVEQFGPPEKIAATVRAHWGVPSGPIKNLVQVAERAGVIVGTSIFGGASVSGVTFRVSGIPPIVLLNELHPADRMRFTLAHELGHLVMHRFPTPESWKRRQMNLRLPFLFRLSRTRHFLGSTQNSLNRRPRRTANMTDRFCDHESCCSFMGLCD